MYTIENHSTYEYEIKKSKFITLLYPIQNIEEVDNYLKRVKNTYKDATHYCYAYKLGSTQKFSDDGEPGGTAGLPMIEILNKRELDNILCIVVRYFGGIKLGASGLTRAYAKAVRNAIDCNQIVEMVDGYFIQVIVDYDEQKQCDYLWKNWIIQKDFQEKIIYKLEIKKDKIVEFQNYNFQILETKQIKKKES